MAILGVPLVTKECNRPLTSEFDSRRKLHLGLLRFHAPEKDAPKFGTVSTSHSLSTFFRIAEAAKMQVFYPSHGKMLSQNAF